MLKTVTFATIVFSSMLFITPASAFSVDGVGAQQCSEVVADYKSSPTATANDMMGWAYGYMTRRNYERSQKGQAQIQLQSRKFDPAAMVGLMLKFCSDNPNVRYYEAVDALFEVLAEQQGGTS